jgi:predicted esterase
MASTHVIPATTHGRYLVEPGPAERLLVGFHGYGETAEHSMTAMSSIPGIENWTRVAIQALHRFYLGRSGMVGASWMTSQDRELAIADNVAYVRSVVAELPAPRALVFLGFSQGAAMAYRAAAAHPHAAAVIVLGGDAPAEITGPLPPLLIGRGTQEEWYTDEKLKKDLSILGTITTVETCVYEGGHEWTAEFHEAAGRFLRTHGSF